MWITHPGEGKNDGLFLFKKSFTTEALPEKAVIRVCADTKYRLYINNEIVALGPVKRSSFSTYYDEIDVAGFLKKGENEITAFVLNLPATQYTKDGFLYYAAWIRSGIAAFMLEGALPETDGTWLVSKCGEYSLNYELPNILSGGFETVDYCSFKRDFVPALALSPTMCEAPVSYCGTILPWVMKKRPIPMLTYNRREFLPVEKGSKFVLNAGFETTGVLHLSIKGEKGARVKILFAEAYHFKDENGGWYKDVRDDDSGTLCTQCGEFYDTVILDGKEREYESFYLRAFRFIQIEITGNATVEDAYYYEIKYPLNTEGKFASDDKDAKQLWDVSIRTLNNCMHDSFEDCPFYEQMQYAMDSRLQALFQRQLSGDRLLIKKCIDDFRESVLPDGMVQARLSAERQVIPGFAFHYVFMIHDYMLYDGDKAYIKSLLPTVDGIFEWMERKTQNGVLGALGNWSYIDWVDSWQGGVPSWTEPLAVYNFMYVAALEDAAELAEFAGRAALKEEYIERAEAIRKNSIEMFFDKDKRFFRDTPGGGFSMHGQIWAVLADAVTGNNATELLTRCLDDKALPVCSYSMMYFVFRALEKAGLYGRAYGLLDGWRTMLEKHCTTWVENGLNGRSECHGWGSTPIYEFAACVLGVRPCACGYGAVLVKPFIEANEYAHGCVSTTNGNVTVSWKKQNGIFTLTVETELNKAVPVFVLLPDNALYKLKNSKQTFVCRL